MRTLHSLALLGAVLLGPSTSAAVSGVLMTKDGQPIEGARVALHDVELADEERARLLSETPVRKPLATTQTGSKGTFSLESPDPGVYDLTIVAAGYVPVQVVIEHDEDLGAIALTKAELEQGVITSRGKALAGAVISLHYGNAEYVTRTDEKGRYSAPDPKHARRIVVTHPEIGIDEQPRNAGPGSALLTLTRAVTPGPALHGRVVAGDGKTGVGGVVIRVDEWPLAKSAEDGSFTIAHAPAGWRSLTAEAGDRLGRRWSNATAPHVVRLEKASVISGRVTGTDGRSPVAHAIVTLRAVQRMGPLFATARQLSDAKGAYSFSVPAGTYELAVSHPAYAFATAEASPAAAQMLTRDVPLKRLARVSGIVLDERREPVVAASVMPRQTGSDFARMRRVRVAGTNTISGPDGRFAMRISPDEELLLRAVRPGYPEGTTEPFTLEPGARWNGVAITIPTGVAVTGRVTDRDGNPLADVLVSATPTAGGGNTMISTVILGGLRGEDADAVRTDRNGTFTYRAREGTYDFKFASDGWSPKTVRSQQVSHGVPTTVDVTLEPAVEISGRVVREGSGVENVRLHIFAPGAEPVNATTAEDGSFTLSGLAPGPVQLMLVSQFTREQRSVTAPTRDLVIELPPGGRVTGRVVDQSSGKPLTDFQAGISLSRSGGGRVMLMPPQLEPFTSDDGTFTLENVPAGAMTLVAEAPGYASGRANVTIEEGKTVEDVEVALQPAVRLYGRVTGADGGPLAGVEVSPAPAAVSGGGGAFGFMSDSATTNAAGEYSLDGLTAGEATFLFQHDAHASSRKTVTLRGSETRLDAQLAAGRPVRGMVVDEGGAPVADAQVEVMGSATFDRASTNPKGEFEFKSLEPGRYRINASKAGLVSTSLDGVDISEGTPIRIELKTGATLYGRITGLAPEEYAQTRILASAGPSRGTATVDSSGNYRLQGAPTGTVRVTAHVVSRGGPSRSSTTQTVELSTGASRQLDLEFRNDVVIEGKVTRDGQPLGQVNVSFIPRVQGSGSFASVQTGDDGSYRLTGVEDGHYSVNVFDQRQFISHSTTHEVRGSGRFDIVITTSPVRGRVIDVGTGEPLGDVSVQLRSNAPTSGPGGVRSSLTDVQGQFSFDAVSEGGYTLTATKDGYGAQPLDVTVGATPLEGLEVVLSRSSGATIRAVDARSGRVVPSSAIVFDPAGRVVHDGRSQIFGGGAPTEVTLPLAPGSYVATVLSPGLAARSVSLQVPGTQTVQLSQGGTLQVRSTQSSPMRLLLLDASGVPYPRVAAFPTYRPLAPGVTVDVPNVAPGMYTVQAIDHDNSVAASQSVTVSEGQSTMTDL